MKKTIVATLLLLAGHIAAHAQNPYDFSVRTETYAPLTAAINMAASGWDDESYQVPLGFNFNMDGNVISKFNMIAVDLVGTDTAESIPITCFAVITADVWDRRNVNSSTASTISYKVTGTAPNRIFVAEVANAGFVEEDFEYSTNDDSINFQVWLYESSNVFEIHYGPSRVSHQSDYFNPMGKPIIAFIRKLKPNGTADKVYYLTGNAGAPSVDSSGNLAMVSNGIDSYPVNGTVYRWSPKTLGIKELAAKLSNTSVYPTACHNTMTISNNEAGTVNYRLLNTFGQVLSTAALPVGNNDIDMSNIPAGTYTVHLYNDAGTKTVKVVKL